MLTFFRVNDPYRILGIFIWIVLTRLLYLWIGGHLTLPELNWMLVGEKLSEGHRLYVGVWDNIGPLSALVYRMVESVTDRHQWVYVILAALLTTYQALVFNNFLLSKKAYHESTYVPALVYGWLSCFSFDFYTLSPVLLSLTWVLLAMRNIFYRVESQSRDERVLSTGLFLGIASLFYMPAVVFMSSTFIAYLLYASISPRRFLLLLFGFALPLLLAATYFFSFESLPAFIDQYLVSFRYMSSQPYISLTAALVISAVPLAFLLVAFYKLSQSRRYTNQQAKLQRIMVLKLAAAAVIIVFAKDRAPYHLWLLVPPLAFFITHFLLIIRRLWLAEIIAFAFALLLVSNGYAMLFGLFSLDKAAGTAALLTRPTAYDEVVAGKKVVLLGDDLNVYRHARLATPYLDWQLASRQLEEVSYFENLAQVYVGFSEDMPDVIIDEAQLMPRLSERIPVLRDSYQKLRNKDIYIKKGIDGSQSIGKY